MDDDEDPRDDAALATALAQGDGLAGWRLGARLEARGEQRAALDTYLAAAEAGETEARLSAGLLLEDELHDPEGAARQYALAAWAGEVGGWINWGLLARSDGRTDEAEERFRRAAEQGDAQGMSLLAKLLHDREALEEAERWYPRALVADVDVDTGVGDDLGHLYREQGRDDEAERQFRAAMLAGEARAVLSLGSLLSGTGAATRRWSCTASSWRAATSTSC